MKKIKKYLPHNLLKKCLVALAAGAFSVYAFAPFSILFFASLSLVVLFLLLDDTINKGGSKADLFWLGWCYGFGYFLAGIYWIGISLFVDAEKFIWLLPFALTLVPGYLALYFGLLALCYKFLLRIIAVDKKWLRILCFSLSWMMCEFLRANFPLGFPWNLLGYVFVDHLSLAQAASVVGVYGLSLLALLLLLVPALFISWHKGRAVFSLKGNAGYLVVIVVLMLAVLVYGNNRLQQTVVKKNEKVRIVQANIAQKAHSTYEEKYRDLQEVMDLSVAGEDVASGVQKSLRAIIWSESAIPFVIDGNSDTLINHLAKVIPQDAVLISGAMRAKYNDFFSKFDAIYNSVLTVDASGATTFYDKHHLVPFGEYVPLQRILPFIEQITGGMPFSEGKGPMTVSVNNFSFSPLVCYEAIFTQSAIDKNGKRPDLLVNVTNDAWFGNSIGPYQHLAMAQLRSVEYGIPMIRVANTGISAVIDPYGRVVAKIGLSEKGWRDVDVIESVPETIYERFGSFLVVILLLVVMGVVVGVKNYGLRAKN